MVEGIVRWCLKHRLMVVIVISVVTLASAVVYLKNIGQSDNSMPIWFEPNNPDYQSYQDFVKDFGYDRSVVIVFEVPEVFSTEALNVIYQTSEKLKSIPDVERVVSITHIASIEGKGTQIQIRPFIPEVPTNDEQLKQLKQKAMADPDFVGNVISADSKIAAIFATVSTPSVSESSRRLKQAVAEIVEQTNTPGYSIHLSGMPITDEAFDRLTLHDQVGLFPLTILMVISLKVLRAIDAFKVDAFKYSYTKKDFTVSNYIKKINQAFHEGNPSAYRIPDTQAEIAQLLFFASNSENTDIDRYKTADNKKLCLAFRNTSISSSSSKKYLKSILEEANKHFHPLGLQASLTGWGPLWVSLDNQILWSQIYSLIIAFSIVTIMMIFVLKSVKAGLMSMIPNVVPIIFAMGFMGFAGIELNVATLMIAAVSVGITVDDTIHYMTRFRENFHLEKDYKKALRLTNQTVGTAIIFTSCVIVGGFSVLMFGSFMPTVQFGGLVSLTLLFSIVCEIFLTPILIAWLKPYHNI